jgi:hypothetical protein
LSIGPSRLFAVRRTSFSERSLGKGVYYYLSESRLSARIFELGTQELRKWKPGTQTGVQASLPGFLVFLFLIS